MAKDDRIGTCRLCNRRAPLCRSHIVPEFCYKKSYDSQHRVLDMNLRGKAGPPARFLQKGHREYLLCESCESRISRHERSFAHFWFGPHGLPKSVDPRCEWLALSGAPYAAFRLFHLSVLWRAGVSTLCRGVSLGPYEPKIRKMILEDDAGEPAQFPLAGQVLVDETGVVMHGFVTSPCRYRSPPSYAYRACYAGCEWHVIVTDHPTAEQQVLSGALNSKGQVLMPCAHWLHTGTMSTLADAYRRRNPACSH